MATPTCTHPPPRDTRAPAPLGAQSWVPSTRAPRWGGPHSGRKQPPPSPGGRPPSMKPSPGLGGACAGAGHSRGGSLPCPLLRPAPPLLDPTQPRSRGPWSTEPTSPTWDPNPQSSDGGFSSPFLWVSASQALGGPWQRRQIRRGDAGRVLPFTWAPPRARSKLGSAGAGGVAGGPGSPARERGAQWGAARLQPPKAARIRDRRRNRKGPSGLLRRGRRKEEEAPRPPAPTPPLPSQSAWTRTPRAPGSSQRPPQGGEGRGREAALGQSIPGRGARGAGGKRGEGAGSRGAPRDAPLCTGPHNHGSPRSRDSLSGSRCRGRACEATWGRL